MTKKISTSHWVVEFTQPRTYDSGHVWMENKSCDVLGDTLESALTAWREEFPDGVAIVVRKIGRGTTLLVVEGDDGE